MMEAVEQLADELFEDEPFATVSGKQIWVSSRVSLANSCMTAFVYSSRH
jgi:hypothetical protein